MKLAYNETFFLKISFIYFFSEGKGGRKRGRETSMCKRNIGWLLLTCPQQGDLAHNQGMCPVLETNWPLFALQNNTQPTEPHKLWVFPNIFNGR